MRFILPLWELIADIVETHVRACSSTVC